MMNENIITSALSPFSRFCQNGLSPLNSVKKLQDNQFTFGRNQKMSSFDEFSLKTPDSLAKKRKIITELFKPVRIPAFKMDYDRKVSPRLEHDKVDPINKTFSKKIRKMFTEFSSQNPSKTEITLASHARIIENLVSKPINIFETSDDTSCTQFSKFSVQEYENKLKEKAKPPQDLLRNACRAYLREVIDERIHPENKTNNNVHGVASLECSSQDDQRVAKKLNFNDAIDDISSKDYPRCNCKRTKCLKLYCECFAAGRLCSVACKCDGCHNDEPGLNRRNSTIAEMIKRNPVCFSGIEIEEYPQENQATLIESDSSAQKQTKGCNCKRSGCNKRYCDCFAAGIGCSKLCQCIDCMNGDKKKVKLAEKQDRFSKVQDKKESVLHEKDSALDQSSSRNKVKLTSNYYKNSLILSKLRHRVSRQSDES